MAPTRGHAGVKEIDDSVARFFTGNVGCCTEAAAAPVELGYVGGWHKAEIWDHCDVFRPHSIVKNADMRCDGCRGI